MNSCSVTTTCSCRESTAKMNGCTSDYTVSGIAVHTERKNPIGLADRILSSSSTQFIPLQLLVPISIDRQL